MESHKLKDSFPALEEQELEALYRAPCKGQCLLGGALAKTYTVAKARSDAVPLFSVNHPIAYAEGKAPKKRRKNKNKQASQKGKTDKSNGNKQNQNFSVTSHAEGARQVSNPPPTTSNQRGRGRGRGKKKQ